MNTIWKIISIASFGLLVYQIFFQKSQNTEQVHQPIEYEYSGQVCYIAEEMPRFPGCEVFGHTKQERQSCANQVLMEFIYSNLDFNPNINHMEGTAVVQFTVQKDGRTSDIEILRSLSDQLDKKIVMMIKKMPRWIPAKQSGKAVAVRFTLPIKINLK